AGALSTYPLSWDTRSAEEGGQQWFELHGEPFSAGDPMHWTGRANRWNSQCADCHSTALEKNFDAGSGSYATTFAIEDVGCEACHGPGSNHVAGPEAAPLAALASQAEEINACAGCHSRRSQLAEGFQPTESYLDYYSPRFLDRDLYHVDGQIDDEVYVYGSFLSSPMHRAGVTCSNCHEPHGATLARSGNETCTFCHQQEPAEAMALNPAFAAAAGAYDDPSHHFHPAGSESAQCVSCHMPSKTYMVVDDRRDHSFPRPRPDLTVALGVPEPCTTCHKDQTAAWAAAEISKRFGAERPAHFATAFAAADVVAPDADAALATIVRDVTAPIMVRASALSRLGAYGRGHTIDAIRLARRGDPLLRLAAPLAAASLSPENQWRLIAPLLEDERQAVREQAFAALVPSVQADPAYLERLRPYLEPWLEAQTLNMDFPETLTNVAGTLAAFGDLTNAERMLEQSLALQANWVPGLTNLADLYRATGRDGAAGELLAEARALAPAAPEVAYAYGLWFARQGQLGNALDEFRSAANLGPNNSRYGYTYAVALNDAGNRNQAVAVLESLLDRWPNDEELLVAVVTMLRDQGRFKEALPYLDRMLEQNPSDEGLRQFRETMARAANAG
ncbi:MAG: multiheme c-type cytochrome, partial [Pseudomonadota bacterium]